MHVSLLCKGCIAAHLNISFCTKKSYLIPIEFNDIRMLGWILTLIVAMIWVKLVFQRMGWGFGFVTLTSSRNQTTSQIATHLSIVSLSRHFPFLGYNSNLMGMINLIPKLSKQRIGSLYTVLISYLIIISHYIDTAAKIGFASDEILHIISYWTFNITFIYNKNIHATRPNLKTSWHFFYPIFH